MAKKTESGPQASKAAAVVDLSSDVRSLTLEQLREQDAALATIPATDAPARLAAAYERREKLVRELDELINALRAEADAAMHDQRLRAERRRRLRAELDRREAAERRRAAAASPLSEAAA